MAVHIIKRNTKIYGLLSRLYERTLGRFNAKLVDIKVMLVLFYLFILINRDRNWNDIYIFRRTVSMNVR